MSVQVHACRGHVQKAPSYTILHLSHAAITGNSWKLFGQRSRRHTQFAFIWFSVTQKLVYSNSLQNFVTSNHLNLHNSEVRHGRAPHTAVLIFQLRHKQQLVPRVAPVVQHAQQSGYIQGLGGQPRADHVVGARHAFYAVWKKSSDILSVMIYVGQSEHGLHSIIYLLLFYAVWKNYKSIIRADVGLKFLISKELKVEHDMHSMQSARFVPRFQS